jgi:hypothetical protein
LHTSAEYDGAKRVREPEWVLLQSERCGKAEKWPRIVHGVQLLYPRNGKHGEEKSHEKVDEINKITGGNHFN